MLVVGFTAVLAGMVMVYLAVVDIPFREALTDLLENGVVTVRRK